MVLSRTAAALAAALLMAGCATTAPLSFLDGALQTRVETDLYPVRIVSVDGSIQFGNPVAVFPGPRWIVTEAAPGSAAGPVRQQAMVIKVAPCTRYFLAARRATPMASEWQLLVERTEPVPGCASEQELKKAGPLAAPMPMPAR